jgi:hypothetical protein
VFRLRISASQAWIGARVCSVISNLHRPARLLLNDGRAVTDSTANADIVDLQPHEIAAPEFAVDREVEQGEVAGSALHLEPDPDRPHVLRLERALLPIRRPLFQGSRRGTDGWLLSSMIVFSEPTAPSRLRLDQGRRSILCPVAGFLLKPALSSSAANGSTPYRSIPSLWLTVIMTFRRPCKP